MRISSAFNGVVVADLEPSGTTGWLSTYIVLGSESVAIVDPGPKSSAEAFAELIDMLDVRRFKKVYIALTHVHIDHAGVTGDLVEILPNALVLVHSRGVKHLVDPSKLWQSSLEVLGENAKLLGEPKPVPQDRIVGLVDRVRIELSGAELVGIPTPGHAPHHVSYLLEPGGLLFAGDSIANYFNGRLYPVTVHPFDSEEYLRSLDSMLKLQPKKIGVAHYGLVDEEPEVFIQRARDKLISWIYHIGSLINSGISKPEDIYQHVLSRDVELAYAKRLEELMPAFRGSTYRVIAGLHSYISRKNRTL
ncbi:MAG: MBL fold metallo-hydrolase [Sulfolobales archaeon]|nr:MBL fold metallo-hydrolase [Sulfolobales archaeon]MCX8208636.1 MBL fold metallo-hydrolase [Sulfolobales archaeon]MDW8010377.1 MBL fold metallo-hydrolase [Sulfolobales archaeon]